jgi:hypothetical protein
MAIYHFSVKTVARSAGRSATAAIAYRAGEKIYCEREGREHDYSRKTGWNTKRFTPEGAPEHLKNREKLWNEVEQRETRKNSTVAREFEIAFPSELNQEQRLAMLEELCASIVERHQVAVDACIHAPHTGSGSDERNYHAHILMSTRKLTPEGFTEKPGNWIRNTVEKSSTGANTLPISAICTSTWPDSQPGRPPQLQRPGEWIRSDPARRTKSHRTTQKSIETEISRTNDEIKERNQAQLQYGKNMDLLIAENEITLEKLKTEQQMHIQNSAKTPPLSAEEQFQYIQRETLSKLLKGEISAKEANLDLDFMQHNLEKVEGILSKQQKHKNDFNQQLAQDIVKSRLKQSHDKLQSLVDQHNELGQNKPLLFGKSLGRHNVMRFTKNTNN